MAKRNYSLPALPPELLEALGSSFGYAVEGNVLVPSRRLPAHALKALELSMRVLRITSELHRDDLDERTRLILGAVVSNLSDAYEPPPAANVPEALMAASDAGRREYERLVSQGHADDEALTLSVIGSLAIAEIDVPHAAELLEDRRELLSAAIRGWYDRRGAQRRLDKRWEAVETLFNSIGIRAEAESLRSAWNKYAEPRGLKAKGESLAVPRRGARKPRRS